MAECSNQGIWIEIHLDRNYQDLLQDSDYNDPKKLLIHIRSKKIHKDLRKSVKLFSYWARNIEIYISNSQRLNTLKQELHVKQDLIKSRSEKPQTRGSTKEQTKHSLVKALSERIDKFNKVDQKQSIVIRKFFEIWKEKNKLTHLHLRHFKDITEETINTISNVIKTELVNTQQKTKIRNNTRNRKNTAGVTLDTLNKNINDITSAIKSYQTAIKTDNVIRTEIKSQIKEIKEIKSKMKQIEDLKFNIECNNDDSTNFVAAEVGFLVEVQAKGSDKPHIDYYNYPVTFTNKNTFSIYDLQNEEFNYFSFKNKKLCHSNYIVDDIIIKHTTRSGRSQADPSNDYHSESVLFFLCQQRSFQGKIINKLIKDLKVEGLKLTKLEKLVLEIHSTNNICTQCFQKAKYLIDWKAENAKLIQEKQGNHFLEYFRQTLTKMLEKDKVLDKKSVLDLKVEIRFSYAEVYSKASTESDPCIIRFKNDNNNLLDSDRILSKYSIITSGGVASVHNNYTYAYNKAVEPARTHAVKKITKAWKEQKKTSNDAEVNLLSSIKKNPGAKNDL